MPLKKEAVLSNIVVNIKSGIQTSDPYSHSCEVMLRGLQNVSTTNRRHPFWCVCACVSACVHVRPVARNGLGRLTTHLRSSCPPVFPVWPLFWRPSSGCLFSPRGGLTILSAADFPESLLPPSPKMRPALLSQWGDEMKALPWHEMK